MKAQNVVGFLGLFQGKLCRFCIQKHFELPQTFLPPPPSPRHQPEHFPVPSRCQSVCALLMSWRFLCSSGSTHWTESCLALVAPAQGCWQNSHFGSLAQYEFFKFSWPVRNEFLKFLWPVHKPENAFFQELPKSHILTVNSPLPGASCNTPAPGCNYKITFLIFMVMSIFENVKGILHCSPTHFTSVFTEWNEPRLILMSLSR